MVNVLIDLFLVLWIVAFGAMAIVPLVLGGSRPAQPAVETEDRVLSIVPSPIVDRIHPRRPAPTSPAQRRAA